MLATTGKVLFRFGAGLIAIAVISFFLILLRLIPLGVCSRALPGGLCVLGIEAGLALGPIFLGLGWVVQIPSVNRGKLLRARLEQS
jgi:hypothetical protein